MDKILITLRRQAWALAKGHLQAMLETYWAGTGGRFDDADKAISEFITLVEENFL